MVALSESELRDYREQGYVVPASRLPTPRVEQLRAALDDLLARNPGIRPEKLVSAHLEGRNAEGVVGSRHFLDLARDPALVELVASVLGPDVVLWGCQIFCKPARDGLEVPLHQDGQYWPIRPLATCTLWLALDPSRADNGCLRVVPGSHRARRLLAHRHDEREGLVLRDRVREDELEAAPRDIELEPGQFSLHDVYLVHGSNPNRSERRRAGVAIRYMPATSLFDRGRIPTTDRSGYTVDFANRPLWLVHGRDRAGNDFRTGHAPTGPVVAAGP